VVLSVRAEPLRFWIEPRKDQAMNSEHTPSNQPEAPARSQEPLVGIVRFQNANGVKFRAVPITGGYKIQRRIFFIWVNETVRLATRRDIGAGLAEITVERVPLTCSEADFHRLVASGTMILNANSSLHRMAHGQEKESGI